MATSSRRLLCCCPLPPRLTVSLPQATTTLVSQSRSQNSCVEEGRVLRSFQTRCSTCLEAGGWMDQRQQVASLHILTHVRGVQLRAPCLVELQVVQRQGIVYAEGAVLHFLKVIHQLRQQGASAMGGMWRVAGRSMNDARQPC